jgi:hypothetical protein
MKLRDRYWQWRVRHLKPFEGIELPGGTYTKCFPLIETDPPELAILFRTVAAFQPPR